MDNHNDTDIINEASTVQEEIEKRILFARKALAGNTPMFSPHSAIPSLKAAIDMGSSEAKGILAGYYYSAKGEDQNYEEALRLAAEAAADGDPDGLCVLGQIYFDGRAADTDYSKAFSLFKEAAEKGNPEAQYRLGSCYYDGRGTEKDLYKARDWFSKASGNGHSLAVSSLKRINEIIEDAESRDAAVFMAESGDYDSVIALGKEYYEKSKIFKNDLELFRKAEELLLMGAEHGDPECQFLLSSCFNREEYMTHDKAEKQEYRKLRAHWLEEAAIFGKYPDAIFSLANHYRSGTLFEKDPEAAFRYYKYAAEAGHPESMSALSSCYERGEGVKADIDKAIEWSGKSLERRKELGEETYYASTQLNNLLQKKENAENKKKIDYKAFASKIKHLWSDISFSVYGILAVIALCLLMLFYRALGSGLFYRPLINVHGLGGLLLKAICFAGIFFAAFVSLLSLLAPIGLEFFAAYPGALMVLALAVGIKEGSPFYRCLSYAAAGIITVNLIIIIVNVIKSLLSEPKS